MRLIFTLMFFCLLLIFISCKKQGIVHDLPIIYLDALNEDLFSDSTGIYVKGVGTASNWQGQKANYFEGRKINASFSYQVNQKQVLNHNVRIKVSGGGSRKQAQKSFNLSLSKKLAKPFLEYKFFENLNISSFHNLRLRVSGQDWKKTHIRDALMHSLVSDLDIDLQAYQPVVLYLNQEYWGIYNLREKFNSHYLRSHHGIDKNLVIDILEQDHQVIKGSDSTYLEMLSFISENNLADDSNFLLLESMIDLNNLMDYYCSEIYFANTDWPGNNIKFWKTRQKNAKWRWFMHDTDLGFGRAPLYGHPGGVSHNTLLFNLNDQETSLHNQPWATLLFRKLLQNKGFQLRFKEHFENLIQTNFSPSRVIHFIDSLSIQIRTEIPNHIDRWAGLDSELYQNPSEWEKNIEELREFARRRPAIIKTHLDSLPSYQK